MRLIPKLYASFGLVLTIAIASVAMAELRKDVIRVIEWCAET